MLALLAASVFLDTLNLFLFFLRIFTREENRGGPQAAQLARATKSPARWGAKSSGSWLAR
jgi:hypothetical protein